MNSLAREVTKWAAACDKRLLRLESYINSTEDHCVCSFVGDEAKDCKLALFCDANFAGDLQDSKSTSGVILCLVGPNTFCPLSSLCKKQGAVSHSSSEAEVISLETGVRMEGFPALDFWGTVISVLHPNATKLRQENVLVPISRDLQFLVQVDYVPPTIPATTFAKMVILEDNDAVIKMCIKGRSPNMRHVARTHRVDLDWLFERLIKDPSITMRYINTKQQLADMFAKGSFTESTWRALLSLILIAPARQKSQ